MYAATIDVDVARQSGGVYLVRLEDTDQARVAEGAAEQFAEAFAYFSIGPDEDDQTGHYGPYSQSARAQIYLTYVRELLRQGRAYPCFATKQDLEEITARQRAAGALPGYYGTWAIWRDADPEEVAKRLAAGEPYVVRFRSPGVAGARVSFTDAIRGELSLDDNRNDAVILKSSDTEPRLPTYHFAHAVDDHLMRVNLVIRGEEWISSVPLHLQLFDALGFARVQYAHIALLMKQEGGSRRKLSKRRDPEATVSFYIEQGYPAPAVQYYLRGLANGRLAEMPLAEALAAPIRLSECGTAGPLVDMVKLDDICADYIATLPGQQILAEVSTWAAAMPPTWPRSWPPSRTLALRALAIEREGVANPRKDLRKWADFRDVYGYFFPQLFELVTDPADARFGGLDPDLVRAVADAFAAGYQPPAPETDWFDQIRRLAADLGFAPSQKVYKQDPAAYRGSIARGVPGHPGAAHRDAAQPRPGRGGRGARHRRGPAPRPGCPGGAVPRRRPSSRASSLFRAARCLAPAAGTSLSRFSCWASFSTTSCCSCAFSAVCLASSEARPPSWRTPTSSMSTWLDAKMTMPSTRRSFCSGGDRAAPTFAASDGFGGVRGELVALLEDPLVELHDRPVQGQVPDVLGGQAEPLALAEAAAVGQHGGRPERQRYQRIPVFLGLGQLGEQPLAAVHDELKILDDRRLIGENMRGRHVEGNGRHRHP